MFALFYYTMNFPRKKLWHFIAFKTSSVINIVLLKYHQEGKTLAIKLQHNAFLHRIFNLFKELLYTYLDINQISHLDI